MSKSNTRRASAVLHVSPDCLERLRKQAAHESKKRGGTVSMGQMVEIMQDEHDRRQR